MADAAGDLGDLLQRNSDWAARRLKADPSFFRRLSDQQRPVYFWIGCSDSRVPATEIVDLDPGEMFVHRNVANLAVESDPSFEAALEFAVSELRVKHVIVVGHYGCGGINAACQGRDADAIGRWLAPPRALYRAHTCQLDALAASQREDRLCELNVLDQVARLSRNPVVRGAWSAGQAVALHGLVYSISDGLLKQLSEPVTQAPRG